MRFNGNCQNCQNRYVGCHAECENYINARKDLDRQRQEYYADKEKRRDLDDYYITERRKRKCMVRLKKN